MGGAMIQYYRDLIATVTYDMVEKFISNLEYGFCASFGDIENMFICNRQLFFEKLSEQVNKPIEHIVHEMKNLQPDISKILFTEENLSKIHISKFMQFLDNHGVEYDEFGGKILYDILFPKDEGRSRIYLRWDYFLKRIYPEYVEGDLTQFHQLFTEVYNEIMEYPIK